MNQQMQTCVCFSRPVVEKIQENGLLQQRVSENKVLFTYVGTDVDPLWNSFKDTAKSLFTSLPFVSIHPNLVKVTHALERLLH